MTSESETLSPIKRALLEIRTLKAKLAEAEGALREPIAIVGMGLRFPGGVVDAASYERLLWSAGDAIGPIPRERWSLEDLYADDPDAPGRMTTRYGGFIDDVDRFDAEHFGISPREADSMDPQQRLLLEVAWHALEDAGHAPSSLAGTRAGVYLGISNGDYGRALLAQRDLIDPYFSTGNAYSVAAGRLAYFLGLHGPSIAVDTACSSSLVALHLACQGLRLGDCDTALAGAVNLVLSPEMNISFSKARMMAPDGRCKTFDAAADGYVRGEGCAVLVLRRLADALASNDRILAVVRGTATNQDGRSNGITAPNGPAQEDVIRRALAAAGISGREVGYVETHGTGTPLGDPIEVGAIGAVLCEEREQPLTIGSVKTNIGHLEACAGLAGVIKVVLGLGRGEIPPNLHFKSGNPMIDWSNLPIRVPTKPTPWEPIDGRRIAGVSSFGFAGTNAHAILEEAPPQPSATTPDRPFHILALSARDDAALRELASRYEPRIATGSIADICFTANAGRSHFAHRLAVVGKTTDDLSRALSSYVRGEPSAALATGTGTTRPKVAFLFTGQGAQSVGMGRALYETSPVFRQALDACAAAFAPHLERGVLDVVFASSPDAPSIDDSTYAQPATFAIEYAFAELWRSWGIEPAFVLGHSLGEYAAACVAGVLSLEDAARVVAHRGKLADSLPRGGAMAAVFAREEIVLAEIAKTSGAVTIAAYNGPEHFVVSGAETEIDAMLSRLETAGVRAKRLRISWASHSPLIEPILPQLRQALASVRFEDPRIALVSNVSGKLARSGEIGAEYWITHMRQPVRFAPAIQLLAKEGVTHFIEVGPHPVLLGIGADCLQEQREWLPSLRRDRDAYCDLLESLQRLYVSGAEIDWAAFDRDLPRRRLALPAYPFRRTRHWVDAIGETPSTTVVSATERWLGMTAALERQSERGPLDLNAPSYPAKWDVLARLTSAHAQRVLVEAQLFAAQGERRTLDDVLTSADIAPTYRHLVQRWLDGLATRGLLRKEDATYVAAAPLTAPDLSALWAEADRLFADNAPLLAYVRNCGALVGQVITENESPLETLFPSGSFDLADGLYQRSTTMRYVNGLAAAAFEALAASTPAGRVLRVLEVGAGTGGTTASLLPVLPKDRARYTFTDVSDVFLDRARTTFARYPFVELARFDLDREPSEQGFAPGTFDVVVSANAVHATKNLRRALERLQALLASGGVLVLVESTVHMDWFDMTTGLIEGWQAFDDDLRTDNPLLPPAKWIEALRSAGFEAASAWPPAGSDAEVLGQHVLVARKPGDRLELATATNVSASPAAPRVAPPSVDRAVLHEVLALLPSERIERLRDFVREHVVTILRLDPARPPARDMRLLDLGFDSLMAVQLRNVLTKELGLERRLPATLLFDYPTIDALAARLLDLITPKSEAADVATVTPVDTPSTLGAAVVAAMSDEEVEALLLKRLEGQ